MHLNCTDSCHTAYYINESTTNIANICPGSQNTSNVETESETDATFINIIYTIVTPVIFLLITLTGVIGNSLVIYVIVSREEMRKLTNLMLLNLAVADIIFLLITPPSTAYIAAGIEWYFGNIMCKVVNCTLNLTVYVTVYTLVLISIVRYMAIVHHSWSATFRTRRNINIAILCIWILMILISIPFGRIFGECLEDGTRQCRILRVVYARNCFTFSCVFAYVLPLAIIGVLSSVTCFHIQKKKELIVDNSKTSETRQKQAGRVITCVVLAFAISWLPVHVDLLWYYWSGHSLRRAHHIYGVVSRSLAYFNSCVNPIIYNFTSKEFRRHFREVILCQKSQPQRPVTFKGSTRSNRTEVTLDNMIPLLEQKTTETKNL